MEGGVRAAADDTRSGGAGGAGGAPGVFQTGVLLKRNATFAFPGLARPWPAPGSPWAELWEGLEELWETQRELGRVWRRSGRLSESLFFHQLGPYESYDIS